MHTGHTVRARVLRVLRDGANTSLVAQMLHSNAVLKPSLKPRQERLSST
jgi:hypothetical protein